MPPVVSKVCVSPTCVYHPHVCITHMCVSPTCVYHPHVCITHTPVSRSIALCPARSLACSNSRSNARVCSFSCSLTNLLALSPSLLFARVSTLVRSPSLSFALPLFSFYLSCSLSRSLSLFFSVPQSLPLDLSLPPSLVCISTHSDTKDRDIVTQRIVIGMPLAYAHILTQRTVTRMLFVSPRYFERCS